MDYSNIINELRAASLFDLYRLRVAIDQQLDNSDRIEQVRARLRPGMKIKYFEEISNRLIEATIVELHRTRLVVENHLDGKRWSIRFCTVNIDDVNTDIRSVPEQNTLDRSQVKVGDHVGFRDRQNQDRYGYVVQLNQKTATIQTSNYERWRVSYKHLFPVIESGAVRT